MLSAARVARSVINKATKGRPLLSLSLRPWSTAANGLTPSLPSTDNNGGIIALGNPCTQARSFSTVEVPPNMRTFPQYTVYGETTMLSLKLILPTFRVKKNVLGVDAGKRGRVVLEWVPRDADGKSL